MVVCKHPLKTHNYHNKFTTTIKRWAWEFLSRPHLVRLRLCKCGTYFATLYKLLSVIFCLTQRLFFNNCTAYQSKETLLILMEAQPKISKHDPKKNSIHHAQNAQQVQKGLQSWRERIERVTNQTNLTPTDIKVCQVLAGPDDGFNSHIRHPAHYQSSAKHHVDAALTIQSWHHEMKRDSKVQHQ